MLKGDIFEYGSDRYKVLRKWPTAVDAFSLTTGSQVRFFTDAEFGPRLPENEYSTTRRIL